MGYASHIGLCITRCVKYALSTFCVAGLQCMNKMKKSLTHPLLFEVSLSPWGAIFSIFSVLVTYWWVRSELMGPSFCLLCQSTSLNSNVECSRESHWCLCGLTNGVPYPTRCPLIAQSRLRAKVARWTNLCFLHLLLVLLYRTEFVSSVENWTPKRWFRWTGNIKALNFILFLRSIRGCIAEKL